MKFLLAEKHSSTQIFDEEGRVRPATILFAGLSKITQVKTKERDGYLAAQVGYGRRSARRLKKPLLGHLRGLPNFARFREFRVRDVKGLERGAALGVSQFAAGDKVSVSAVSKGKGFQGVVRRHGFAGGPRTHGQKHSEREPGSIGATGPQRVFKGTKMAGRMGGRRTTVKNLTVLQIAPERNFLVVSGAVPGRRGTLVEVKSV